MIFLQIDLRGFSSCTFFPVLLRNRQCSGGLTLFLAIILKKCLCAGNVYRCVCVCIYLATKYGFANYWDCQSRVLCEIQISSHFRLVISFKQNFDFLSLIHVYSQPFHIRLFLYRSFISDTGTRYYSLSCNLSKFICIVMLLVSNYYMCRLKLFNSFFFKRLTTTYQKIY